MGVALHPFSLPALAPAGPEQPVADLFAEITAGLAEGQELEALLGQFLAPIVRLAGAQAGLVRTLADDGQHLRLVGEVGLPAGVRRAELSVDRHCGTCGIAADNDVPTWAADLRSCDRHSQQLGYFGGPCKRMLAVPLRHRGRLLGIYNLFFDGEAELSADILAVLRSIGELLGLALHNARLEREHLCATVMSERRFLAGEVHDSIAQMLVYMHMRLPLLREAMLRHDEAQSLKYFTDVEQAVGSIQTNVRELLTNFRTPMDPLGLLHALRGMAADIDQRAAIELVFSCNVPELHLSAEQEVQVFHIVQEALANVCRHARARRAWLTLRQQGEQVEVRVEDDGQGLAPAQSAAPADESPSAHFGLGIMRERAQRLGGALAIGPRAGGGTLVRLTLPLAPRGALGGNAA